MEATIGQGRGSRSGGRPQEASPRRALALIADIWALRRDADRGWSRGERPVLR